MKKVFALFLAFFLLAPSAFATTTFMESGTDATQGFEFYSATSGTVSSDATVSYTGPRSAKLFTSSPAVIASITRSGVIADAGRRISFRFRFDTTPAGNANIMILRVAADNASVFTIQQTTLNKLNCVPQGGTTVTGTTVLTANTWYRISVGYYITNTTTFMFKVYINGNLELTCNAGTLTNTTATLFRLSANSAIGTNATVWFDDIYIDNGASSASQPDVGDVRVTAKRPFANGAANQFTTQVGSGGSGYGSGHAPQVNELPLSTTNGWSLSNTTVQTEEYTIENAESGQVDILNNPIVDSMGWIYAAVDSTSNSPVHNIIVNGVQTAKTMTTSAAFYNAFIGSRTYPTGGTAIGMNAAYTTTPHTTSLYEAGLLVAYMPLARFTLFGGMLKIFGGRLIIK